MKVRILGCGNSGGVPLIGCKCAVCTSNNPRNKRTRVSIVVEHEGTRVLVDASPDLRQQFLAADLSVVDAVILTHGHADHVHGLDDLRSVNYYRNAPLDLWGAADCLAEVQRRFAYAFGPPPKEGHWFLPSLVPRPIDGPFQIGSLRVEPFRQDHGIGRDPVLGLRFGKFAYSTDVKQMPEPAFATLAGVQVWVVDCLMERPNPAHSHLDQTLEWIRRVGPRRAILTHMNHAVDYDAWAARLPVGVEPGYDGLEIEIP
ncbi:MAG TPA: MBL fold metallo-hydrolase [Alphaproteobacteria bacterium]|nr:MBL fold metallo-hydrolase [Alphaproteobacteria bacterium]